MWLSERVCQRQELRLLQAINNSAIVTKNPKRKQKQKHLNYFDRKACRRAAACRTCSAENCRSSSATSTWQRTPILRLPFCSLHLMVKSEQTDGRTDAPTDRPDQTRPDQTRPDQTRPDQTRPDQTRPDQTRQNRPNRDFNDERKGRPTHWTGSSSSTSAWMMVGMQSRRALSVE